MTGCVTEVGVAMNLPEILSANSVMTKVPPKISEPNPDKTSDGDSFMDTLYDASRDIPQADGQRPEGKSNDASGRNETKAVAEQSESPPDTPAPVDEETLAIDGQDGTNDQPGSVVPNARVLSAAILGNQAISTSNPSQPTVPTPSNTANANGSAIGNTIGKAEIFLKGANIGDGLEKKESQPNTTAASQDIEKPEKSSSRVEPSAQTQASPQNITQSLVGIPKGTDVVRLNVVSAAASPATPTSATAVANEAPFAKLQPDGPKAPTSAETNTQADTTKADLKALDQRLTEDAKQDQRQSERRNKEGASDLKLLDRATLQTQPSSSSNLSPQRFGLGQPVLGDVGQTGSTTQQFSLASQSSGTRELTAERSISASTGPIGDPQSTARSAVNQIANAFKNQPMMKTIELSLDPPELGRIDINMEIAEMGLRATLSAERSGTGDMIRRQAELLLQQLDEAGFSDVSLDFRDFGSGEQQSSRGEDHTPQNTLPVGSTAGEVSSTAKIVRAMPNAGMDVRL